MKYFATAMPGLGPLLEQEITRLPGVAGVSGDQCDGRNDIVSFASGGRPGRFGLRLSEDIFVEVASARRTGALKPLLSRLWDEEAVTRALSAYAAHARPLRARLTFRVVARVLTEREFPRTALRDELARTAARARPRWRPGDPADIEFWVVEARPGAFRLGVRLTGGELRRRGGRAEERHGALRPTVAAAMVFLAGPPDDRRLLDPFCGSGTIPAEAAAVGWEPVGSDVDAAAVRVARRNTGPAARLTVADARALPFATHAFGAVAANLPFGKQFTLPHTSGRWFVEVVDELARVTAPGAAVLLLAPPGPAFQRAIERQRGIVLRRRFDIRLLGLPTALWELRRSG